MTYKTAGLALDALLTAIKADYDGWNKRSKEDLERLTSRGYAEDPIYTKIRQDAVDRFNRELRYTIGGKYIKVISGTSVWGFVVLDDGPKFKRGDLLKAASWNAPALNKARGSVRENDLDLSWVRWTGPAYIFSK
jgi:hypothetical protein